MYRFDTDAVPEPYPVNDSMPLTKGYYSGLGVIRIVGLDSDNQLHVADQHFTWTQPCGDKIFKDVSYPGNSYNGENVFAIDADGALYSISTQSCVEEQTVDPNYSTIQWQYLASNINSLSGGEITSMGVDINGVTYEGNGNPGAIYTPIAELSSIKATKAAKLDGAYYATDADGNLWKATANGLPQNITPSGKHIISLLSWMPPAEIVVLDSDGNIWYGSGNGSDWKQLQIGYKVAYIMGEILIAGTPTAVNTPPTISGVYDLQVNQGDSFDPLLGVTAHDNEDGDITDRIQTNGNVDTSTPGTYKITYTVTDSGGLSATAERTITVLASGTTIACAPQTGDPASSIWQAASTLLGLTSIGLAAYLLTLRRRMCVERLS